MVLDAAVDPNVLSYPVPIIMKERGAVVRRGGASLWTSGEVRSIGRGGAKPSGVGRGGVYTSGAGRGGVLLLAVGRGEA